MFHPVEIVVERMINAVVAPEAEIDRGDAGVIQERAEIGSSTEVANRDLTSDLTLWRLPGRAGAFLFRTGHVAAPCFVNAVAGCRVLDLTRGIAHEVLERRRGRRAEIRAGNAHVGVDVGDRLCLQLGAIGFDPAGSAELT